MYTREEVKSFLKRFCNFHEKSVYVLLATTRNKLSDDDNMSVSRIVRRLDNIDYILDEIEAVMGNKSYYLYITVNPRDVSKASTNLMHSMIDFISKQQYKPLKKLDKRYISELMKQSSRFGRGMFMLDVDTKDQDVIVEISRRFEIHYLRSTPNGYHFTVKPFNPKEIETLKDVSLKKDGLLFLNIYHKGVK